VTQLKITSSNFWTGPQAFALAIVSLLLGTCGGWLIRRSVASPARSLVVAPTASASASAVPPLPTQAEVPSPQALKQAADAQAAPLLEQLKAAPTNAALLAQIGNLYYDAKQYPAAIDYYDRSLNSDPRNSSVRTDLGTAYWYTGDANAAIAQFEKVLASEPTKPDTLFNLGIVKLQGKQDAPGAIAAWQKLLATNPTYENKDKVQQLIAQASAH